MYLQPTPAANRDKEQTDTISPLKMEVKKTEDGGFFPSILMQIFWSATALEISKTNLEGRETGGKG